MVHLNKKNSWMYYEGHCPCEFETSITASKITIYYVAWNCSLSRYQESDINLIFNMSQQRGLKEYTPPF